ncbi:MAG TPA: gliding motility lipoprotein GldB [Cytophagaceae bacterium]|jgi:gliding motility-associated lipoprotein GldB
MQKILLTAFIVLIFLSCKDNCRHEVKDISPITVDINRLEDKLFSFKSKEDARAFLQEHKVYTQQFLQTPDINDDKFLTQFYQFYTNPNLKDFYKETKNKFGDLDQLKVELGNLFSYIKHYYPKSFIPQVSSTVTGFQFDKDLLVSDSAIIISIDYFLGKQAKYRPPFFKYFLERYEKEYITPLIGLAMSNKFNVVNTKDETMLANMVYYGKAYYFVERTMPCLPDSMIAMYTTKQMKAITENENIIWGHFIEKKLLFETKPQTIEKYLGESPKISEIGEECPGRIGRWIGWNIVRKYMEGHPEVTLQGLMKEQDAQKIFRLSKYKPKSK